MVHFGHYILANQIPGWEECVAKLSSRIFCVSKNGFCESAIHVLRRRGAIQRDSMLPCMGKILTWTLLVQLLHRLQVAKKKDKILFWSCSCLHCYGGRTP